ncbi:HD domain-containing phosphohydrolase [Jatrophihabitans cynanchi]|jgi:HD-GYP domain-containing protein (c-di-GMP phosphodiesterase class II)/DNA-binding CsgD family transcriptional regulator|uniref:HD domain-containing phosphohydrolase n=1 Tax=Jatrophihabitans cynanchi TaxID=2944128 RepID=UPI0022B24B1C|nr:HD domain-containing phosphohydrolase [Jatrophihabitans sp. SB3-54]
MTRGPAAGGIRLAELLGVMSLGVDLGMGQPMEHVLRQCLIALRLAERAGLDESQQLVVYYTSMLAWVGCHVDAYEQAKWFGDDLALKADFRRVDFAGARAQKLFVLRHLGAGESALRRAGVGLGFARDGGARAAADMISNHWRAADDLAERLGLGASVRDSIEQTFERWDGQGVPKGAKGGDILTTSQLVNLADVVEVFHRAGGVASAVEVARRRSGTQFAPELVELFCRTAAELFADLETSTTWDAVIAAEPASGVWLSDAEFVVALEAIADFVDLKSPYTIGHSRAVADLAQAAARHHGLSEAAAQTVRTAGLVHDLGRLGVPNTIWDKPGELTEAEAERVRMHPYLTERMLAFSDALAPLGAIAVQHHERLDGSGYPRGLGGDTLSPAGRILAAADTYRAWLEPRPHRSAGTVDEVAARLRAEARAGRLDGGVVDAVLRAAGHRVSSRTDWPAGLTAREVQVLRLLARGLSNSQIADELVISRKTVGNHIEHIYAKIGVSNRALASLFASRHGLMSGVTADPI